MRCGAFPGIILHVDGIAKVGINGGNPKFLRPRKRSTDKNGVAYRQKLNGQYGHFCALMPQNHRFHRERPAAPLPQVHGPAQETPKAQGRTLCPALRLRSVLCGSPCPPYGQSLVLQPEPPALFQSKASIALSMSPTCSERLTRLLSLSMRKNSGKALTLYMPTVGDSMPFGSRTHIHGSVSVCCFQ